MSSLLEHFDKEWEINGWPKTKSDAQGDDSQLWIYENIREMLKAFGDAGHSGSSASYAISIFEKAARFGILSPLTGEDNEWIEVGEDTYQNKRCFHVFKEHGEAYDSEGIIFRDSNGSCYTNIESRVPITFPHTPKTRYVETE